MNRNFVLIVILAIFASACSGVSDPSVATATSEVRNMFGAGSPAQQQATSTVPSFTAIPTVVPTNTVQPTNTVAPTLSADERLLTQAFQPTPTTGSATAVPTVEPTAQPQIVGEEAVLAAFSAPVGQAPTGLPESFNSQAAPGGQIVVTPVTVVMPTAQPLNAQGVAESGSCPVDANGTVDPSGEAFPSWDGFNVDDRSSSWPGSYVEYLGGTEATVTREAPTNFDILPGHILVTSGDAISVIGGVEFETFESATTVAIYNGKSETVSVSIQPKASSTFVLMVRPVGSPVESMRAVLSFYTGSLMADNATLERSAFRAALVSPEGTAVLEGLYYRNCGSQTGLSAQSLNIEPTSVPESAWEIFVAPGPITPVTRTLDTARIEQARADTTGCERLEQDVIYDIQCSSAGLLDGTYTLRPGQAIGQFSSQATVKNEDGLVVIPPSYDVPDLWIILNDSDSNLTLEITSLSYGYIVTSTPVRGEWSPELIRSWLEHIIGVSLNPDEVYRDPQTEEFGVALATAVPPCESATGCRLASTTVLRWTGQDWQLLIHGIASEDVNNPFTVTPR